MPETSRSSLLVEASGGRAAQSGQQIEEVGADSPVDILPSGPSRLPRRRQETIDEAENIACFATARRNSRSTEPEHIFAHSRWYASCPRYDHRKVRQGRNKSMSLPSTSTLADEIAERATQLRENLQGKDSDTTILSDIREIRRRLSVLEQDMQDDPTPRGDAC